jgi:hypothetical protein
VPANVVVAAQDLTAFFRQHDESGIGLVDDILAQ